MASLAAAAAERCPSVTIAQGALVCEDCEMLGPYPIIISAGTVIHPCCSIRALGGPITIGEENMIEERAVIENPAADAGGAPAPMVIGSMNLLSVGCKVVGSDVGNLNVIEAKATLQRGCTIGTGCVVGIAVKLAPGTRIDDGSVAFYLSPPGETRIHPAKRLKEQHLSQIRRYLDIMRDDKSRCSLAEFHKLLAPTTTSAGAPK